LLSKEKKLADGFPIKNVGNDEKIVKARDHHEHDRQRMNDM